jgi:hypothetical protein
MLIMKVLVKQNQNGSEKLGTEWQKPDHKGKERRKHYTWRRRRRIDAL